MSLRRVVSIILVISSCALGVSIYQEWLRRPKFADFFSLRELALGNLGEELQFCALFCDQGEKTMAQQALAVHHKVSVYGARVSDHESEIIELLSSAIYFYQDTKNIDGYVKLLLESLKLAAVMPGNTPEQVLFRQRILYSLHQLPQIYPASAQAHFGYAIYLGIKGENFEDVEKSYEQCLKINPQHTGCRENLELLRSQ